MSQKNIFIALGVVLVGAAVVAANLYFRKDKGLTVTTEAIKARVAWVRSATHGP